MSKLMAIHFAGSDLLTGLPEYRNGGLLIDMGLLSLKEADMERGLRSFKENAQIKGQPNMEVVPLFSTDDDVIVEWRAATVGFLDELLDEVNTQLGLTGSEEQLTLAQMLEAGTWKVCSLPHGQNLWKIVLTGVHRVVVKSPKSPGQTPRNRPS
jgi:hypothetical protein